MLREELDEALKLLSLADIDPRLNSKSELSLAHSKLRHTPPLDKQFAVPEPVHSNFRRQKSYMYESLEDKLEDEIGLPDEEELVGGDLEDDLGDEGLGGEEIPGLPSGGGYTVEMAKGQLDGIIGKWMDLAGNYPEGDERHKFMEIGERLREISAVLNRDFIGKR